MTLKQLRNAVANSANGLPVLQDWLNNVSQIHPAVADAIAGVYCGTEGKDVTDPIIGFTGDHSIVVGWYAGHVEYAYVS